VAYLASTKERGHVHEFQDVNEDIIRDSIAASGWEAMRHVELIFPDLFLLDFISALLVAKRDKKLTRL